MVLPPTSTTIESDPDAGVSPLPAGAGLDEPESATLLEVDPGLPLLLLSRHAYDVTGEPVEWAQSWYRGDRYKFVTRLRRSPDR